MPTASRRRGKPSDIRAKADALVVGGMVEAMRREKRGNAAKIREALEDAEKVLDDSSRSMYGVPPHMKDLLARIRAALSEPLRNCDVGSAEEQCDRFLRFCQSRGCVNCEIGDGNWAKFPSCELVWAQMPYEEGSAK